ncbi:Procollagen Galactosyltransferase 1 [Manis pentadactyla]|nr:Procollagen Galactosyltransferase 1 [Manis pentadactyla]
MFILKAAVVLSHIINLFSLNGTFYSLILLPKFILAIGWTVSNSEWVSNPTRSHSKHLLGGWTNNERKQRRHFSWGMDSLVLGVQSCGFPSYGRLLNRRSDFLPKPRHPENIQTEEAFFHHDIGKGHRDPSGNGHFICRPTFKPQNMGFKKIRVKCKTGSLTER